MRGYKCSSPTKQIFLVEVLGDDEEEAEEGDKFMGRWNLKGKKWCPKYPSML